MKNKKFKRILLFAFTLIFVFNSATITAFSVDESDYVASYGIETSHTLVHPGDTIDIFVSLTTNYPVFAAQTAVLYDSTLFEVVIPDGMSSSSSAYLTKIGDFSGYTMTGNASSAEALYLRNSNPEYWSGMADSLKIAFISFAGDSNMGSAVTPTGRIAKFSLKVRDDATFGSSGKVFMNSDWIKDDDCRSGLVFASRSVNGDFSVSSGSYVAMGQTIDLTSADVTVTVGHTQTDWIVDKQPTETERGHEYKKCTVCDIVTQEKEIPALNEGFSINGTVKTFDDGVENSDVTTITFTKQGDTTPAYTVTKEGSGVLDFSLDNVANGKYYVAVSKVNHATRMYEITVDTNITLNMQINLLGDIDGDGYVKMNDLSRINAHIKETKILENYAIACADVNGDGDIRMNDLSRVNAHIKETKPLW